MADKKIEVRLLTPTVRSMLSQYKYNAEVDMVVVRAATGDMGFLAGHLPCSAVLDSGIMRILPGNGENELKLAVLGGVVQVADNIVTVITDTAEWPEDIDRGRAAALRDELQSRIAATEDTAERNELRRQLKSAEVLVTVGGFPPSGIIREKD